MEMKLSRGFQKILLTVARINELPSGPKTSLQAVSISPSKSVDNIQDVNLVPLRDWNSSNWASIILCLEHLSERIRDQMPDLRNYHLPRIQNVDVFEAFKAKHDLFQATKTVL